MYVLGSFSATTTIMTGHIYNVLSPPSHPAKTLLSLLLYSSNYYCAPLLHIYTFIASTYTAKVNVPRRVHMASAGEGRIKEGEKEAVSSFIVSLPCMLLLKVVAVAATAACTPSLPPPPSTTSNIITKSINPLQTRWRRPTAAPASAAAAHTMANICDGGQIGFTIVILNSGYHKISFGKIVGIFLNKSYGIILINFLHYILTR